MGTFLAIVLLSLPSGGVGLQDAAASLGFSGTWVLDPAQSVLHERGAREIELVVVEDQSGVQITDRRGAREVEYGAAFDGQPHERRTPDAVFVRVLRREGGALLFQITMTRLSDQASISYTERWSLSDAGRTLTVHTLYPGNRDVLKVFTRKD